uniref:Uncharacterized protein n=1 Tax=Tanacetum cinerariifolium TaxID=118510 RepID=A0A6L2MJ63_TANCI|nr:hypothetical protein [Tanacetum cinerariifolium]
MVAIVTLENIRVDRKEIETNSSTGKQAGSNQAESEDIVKGLESVKKPHDVVCEDEEDLSGIGANGGDNANIGRYKTSQNGQNMMLSMNGLPQQDYNSAAAAMMMNM